MDVVKIRLQRQVRPLSMGECFVFRNGLMDHLCTCTNSPSTTFKHAVKCEWFNRPGHFNGMFGACSMMLLDYSLILWKFRCFREDSSE